MGNLVYPALPGRSFPSGRTVIPPTVHVRTTPSQREYRARDALLPRYQYNVPYAWLRSRSDSPELQTLLGFYNQVGGAFDTWLYSDPDDAAVADQPFGTGDGATVAFQLVRSFGGFAEGIDACNGTPTIAVAGIPTTSFTVAAGTGRVTFGSPPAGGAALSWSGGYYRRCRFLGDRLDTEKFMARLFTAKRVEFISTKA